GCTTSRTSSPRWPGGRQRSGSGTSTPSWWRWRGGSEGGTTTTSVPDRGADRLAQRADRGEHRGRLVAAVGHAVGAPRVVAPAERGPVGGLDQLPVGAGVAVVEQVARPLPAQQGVRRDGP